MLAEVELEVLGSQIESELDNPVELEEPVNQMDEPLVEVKRRQFFIDGAALLPRARKFFRENGLAIAYPFYAGTIGSVTQLLAKSTAELIKATGSGYPSFAKVQTYLIILGTLALGTHQVS